MVFSNYLACQSISYIEILPFLERLQCLHTTDIFTRHRLQFDWQVVASANDAQSTHTGALQFQYQHIHGRYISNYKYVFNIAAMCHMRHLQHTQRHRGQCVHGLENQPLDCSITWAAATAKHLTISNKSNNFFLPPATCWPIGNCIYTFALQNFFMPLHILLCFRTQTLLLLIL